METLLDRGAQNPEDKDGSRFDESDALNEQGHAAASGCTSEEDFALINSGSACKDSNHNKGPLLNHYTDRTLRQETGRHSDVNEMSTLTNSSMTACQTAKARNEGSTINVPGDLSWSFSGLSVDTRHIFNHLYTWQVLSVIASVIISALSFASVYKTFGETFIHDDMFLAVVGSVSAICNVMGHILGGFAMDYLRVKDVLPTIPAVLSALLLSVSASVHGGKTMYFVWNCGILFIIGVFFAAHPIFVIRAYGAQHFASNLSFFVFSWICFGVIGSFLLSWIKDLLSWPGIFIFLGSLPGGAMVFSMFMNIKNPWGHYI
ncbi:uncharacterized protein [Diadema setosum]|uniref:uncharacterized protein n=1 Tax=Diadema setosum TaxID=31175 RepID=UPI003B3BB93E